MTDAYWSFIASKKRPVVRSGFRVDLQDVNGKLFPFQRELVRWALETGKAALFASCGLGKTGMQLEWSRHVVAHTGGSVLILAPLAVSSQTVREGEKFGIRVAYAKDMSEVREPITITNYERLGKFDATAFSGVVIDESSAIKAYTGKVRAQIFAAFKSTLYKLACTATPAPNDHMELGQHAEFLDVLTSHEMLARWFVNDTQSFGTYRLKGHAVAPFWAWVSSWARCVGTPSDIGFADDGYILPPLRVHQHVIDIDIVKGRGDKLFRLPDLSATSVHGEKRLSAPERAAKVAAIIAAEPDEPWLIWCDTNYEERALLAVIPDAVAVNGGMSLEEKEAGLMGFTEGRIKRIITKASLAGFGLNWQHCARMAFTGPTFSFEQYYQATRRTWRFGQARPVEAHVVMSSTEVPVWNVLQRKADDHRAMQSEMFRASRLAVVRADNAAKKYVATKAWPLRPWVKEDAA